MELKKRHGATVLGPAADRDRIPGIDVALGQGDRYKLGAAEFETLDTPGHTRGHVTYYFPDAKTAFTGAKNGGGVGAGPSQSRDFHPASHQRFTLPLPPTGDTLFSLGCGRFFEGTPAQMQVSLSKIARLPADTRIFCGHEYTASNAKFAASVDPDNEFLREWERKIEQARAAGRATVPSLLGDELQANPFLRPDSPAIRQALGVPPSASNEEALGAIRKAKDSF